MSESTSEPPDHPGQIGPYKLIELLGEGGMGEVWLAEQSKPVHRRVALKVIKLGMDTKQVVARFEAERQALAVMDHPGIAQVFDGGATEEGRPYFVMELVRGVSIHEYCDTHRLSTEERIRLFVGLCHAVQHAHQKGVVHRDLKPSNVLVAVKENEPVVKVIDFGIAKALGYELTDRTLVTRMGQIVGTPEYMSPEQAEMSGLDVDTRTDVYALGVILYELLVGALPFDFSAKADEAIRHAIRETEVPRPSTKLTSLEGARDTIARCRRTTVEALRRELRSDLDWIILKAMEKDRTRRYDTANGLALDLERHLLHEPVLARAPSTRYRVAKFVRRHRLGVAAGGAIAVALILGVSLATVGMVRAQRAERRAEAEAEAARQVSDFLVELFEVNDPSEARGNSITAREILDRGAERIEGELADQPALQGRMMQVMGGVFRSLGLYTEAERLTLQSLEVRRRELGDLHPDLAASLHELAWLYRAQWRLDEALPLAEEAAEIRQMALGPRNPEYATTLQLLGMVQRDRGDFEIATQNLERSLEIRETVLGPEHLAVSMSLYHLGWLFFRSGDYERARGYYERACPIMERELGQGAYELGWCLNDLGIVLDNLGERESALTHFQGALEVFETVLPPEHPSLGTLLNNMGALFWRMGEFEAANLHYERALAIREASLGPESPLTAETLSNLGLVKQSSEEYAEARRYYARALEITEGLFGPESMEVTGPLNNLGFLLRYIGDFDEAETALTRSVRIQEEAVGPTHPDLIPELSNLGFLFRNRGQPDRAIPFFQRAVEIGASTWGADNLQLRGPLLHLAAALTDEGEFEGALTVLERAAQVGTGQPDSSPDIAWNLAWEEGRALHGLGRLEEADTHFQGALAILAGEEGEESGEHAALLARYWSLMGDRVQGMYWFEEALRRGFRKAEMLREPELELLRSHPDYEALANQISAALRR